MVNFNDDHKVERSRDFLSEGIHEIVITDVIFDSTDSGKEYVEFKVEDANGAKDSARLWFTTDKAIEYTFGTIRSIFVHNAPKDEKDRTKEKFNAIKNTAELEKACKKMLIGKEAWFSVYKDETRTYIDNSGTTKFSFNKNLYGYEPTPPTGKTPSNKSAGTMDGIKTEDEDGNEQTVAVF